MNYVVVSHRSIRIDLMVDQEFFPQLVSYCQRMGCTYAEERTAKAVNGHVYRVLKDVKGPNGGALGELLGLFYSLEWGALAEGITKRKFYMMINPRRKEKKKNAGKNRKEADQGSNGGDSGEPSGNPGPGPVGGSAGDGADAGTAGDDGLWELPRVE